MTKWKLVPVEPTNAMVWKAEEDSPEFHHCDPWYGSEPPSEDQIRAIYTAMLVAAPQPPKSEPIAYIEHHKGGDNLVWDNPGGKYSALYTAPPAPSVPDGWREFLTDVITAAGLLDHGKRDKGLADRIGSFAFDAMRGSTPTPAEAPADLVQRLIDGGPQLFPETNHVYRVKNMAIYLWRQYLESERDKLKGGA